MDSKSAKSNKGSLSKNSFKSKDPSQGVHEVQLADLKLSIGLRGNFLVDFYLNLYKLVIGTLTTVLSGLNMYSLKVLLKKIQFQKAPLFKYSAFDKSL